MAFRLSRHEGEHGGQPLARCVAPHPSTLAPHPLQRRVAALGRQVRRLLVVYGLSRVVSVLVVAAIVWGTIDFVIRFDDHGVRLIGSLAVAGLSVWAAARFLLPALRLPLDDLAVAQRVERRFAGLGDQLSSSIEFLKQAENDPLAGSAMLRRAVVAEAEAELLPLNWRSAVDRRPTARALAAALVCCLAAGGLVLGFPSDARVALARLVKPLGDDAWPPVNDLVFTRRVERIARDQPFEVELIDRNRKLPDEVRIQYRFDAADSHGQQLVQERMQRIGDLMVARRDRILQPFEYRAEGGDDRKMPWIHVDVVAPPQIESLKLTLHPPSYTGWPEQTAERRIVALRGTTVEMSARANKPLAAATLHQPNGSEVPLQLSADGLSLTIAAAKPQPAGALAAGSEGWVIEKSGQYWFELRDREGLTGGSTDRWDILAVADQPPTVAIQQPDGNLMVTTGATVPLKILAKDDITLRTVGLVYTRSDHSELGEIVEPLFTGPEPPPKTVPLGPSGLLPGAMREIAYSWDLATLHLPPGTQLLLTATATDYVPQKGVSPPRRITIITPQELDDRLAQRQSLIYSELGRILKLQQADRLQTSALETQLQQVGRFQKQDLDQLRAAELNQRQIHRSLTGPLDGVQALVAELLGELTANHIDNPDMRRRMQGLADELTRMDGAELSTAERDLTAALKATDDSPTAPVSPAGRHALTDAGRDQDAVASALERLLGDLAEWNSFRGLARELGQVRRDLADVQQATKDLGAHTLTQDLHDLSPQQQADLKKLSQRQVDLARQFDKLQGRLEQVSGQLRASDPLAADSLSDALDVARRQAPSGMMRDAGESLAANRIGQALDQQTASGKALDEMLDILSNRREQELSRLVAKLREAESQLSALRQEEEGLRKKLREAAADPNKGAAAERQAELQRLAARQRQLQQDAEHLARQLQRLQADKAGRSTSRASERLSRSAAGAEKSSADSAASDADAAAKDLEDAQQQLAAARRQTEADLAHEQLARLEDSIQGLVDRQQRAIDETGRLEKLRALQGQLNRGQAQSVLDLGHQQEALAGDTTELAGKLAGAEAFQFLLESAAREMTRTAARLAERDTGPATVELEQDVLARLQQLATALKQNRPGGGKQPGGDNQGPGGAGKQNGGKQRSLAEVRLIQLMQEDLNRRTRRLDDAIGHGRGPTDDVRRQLADLTKEQGRLAELIEKLAAEAAGDEENGQ